ncbi:MAG TPA: hypothetical protein DDW22_00525 [Prevotellaceae bacterium]|nr:hypothetical protein [Prevotellaceae bacterium]
METNAEKHIKVCEARSYARCIALGLSTAADHAGVVLCHIWPSVQLSILLPFPGLIIFAGQLNRLLGEWRELDYVPRRKALDGWRRDLACTGRALASCMLAVAAIALVVGCAWLAWQLLPHGKWAGLATLAILTLALLPLAMTQMEIEYSGNRIGLCLPGCLKGYRHYGSVLAYELLVCMLTALVILLGALPLETIALAMYKAWEATRAGDNVTMTPALQLAAVAAYIIAILATLVAIAVTAFCNILFWGSIQAREEEKREDRQG